MAFAGRLAGCLRAVSLKRTPPFRKNLGQVSSPFLVPTRSVYSHEDLQNKQVLHHSDYTENTSYHPTSVAIMNEDKAILYIDSISNVGFTLNTGALVFGPIALFPNAILSWNVSGAQDITEESLSLFLLIEPQVDILVVGYGDDDGKHLIKSEFISAIQKKGISVECMPTEKAAALYNFLVGEKRLVAGAFLPVVNMSVADTYMPSVDGSSGSLLSQFKEENESAELDEISTENFLKGLPGRMNQRPGPKDQQNKD